MQYKYLPMLLILTLVIKSVDSFGQSLKPELYRPQFHFSPKAHWINDPNGMVYHKGTYHLFFQYHPNSTIWGPMHWGHATSTDLFHWTEKPIALYPDSLGMIFSGSAVVDENNTAGFGKGAIVAIFTHHNHQIEMQKTGLHEYQSLAYSTDDGETWIKYMGNPVLPNPGITDFRDPKVMWYEEGKKWIMTLATKDRVTFYSSTNLKEWTKESDFGSGLGAHGGVWECPDLFPLEHNGKTNWVLLVSINPGGPNGGSATQYFTGTFDGHTFSPNSTIEKWIDYGTDNYAGITWSNTGKRKVFIGWMSNWQYANLVPTIAWRGALTLPRELALKEIGGDLFLQSLPVKEMDKLLIPVYNKSLSVSKKELDLSANIKSLKGKIKLDFSLNSEDNVLVTFDNKEGQKLLIGFDARTKKYFIDRTLAGVSGFEKGFAKKHTALRISQNKVVKMSLILDVASVELFADDGLTVMTDIFFPSSLLNGLKISTIGGGKINNITISGFK